MTVRILRYKIRTRDDQKLKIISLKTNMLNVSAKPWPVFKSEWEISSDICKGFKGGNDFIEERLNVVEHFLMRQFT